MDYTIRNIRETEYKILSDFLYEAIFIPEGVKAPPKDIINKPELQVYISDFGKHSGDYCLVAESDKKIVGAVWVRIMNDYGHVDNETPSFAISLFPEYRNHGIGTEEKAYLEENIGQQKNISKHHLPFKKQTMQLICTRMLDLK